MVLETKIFNQILIENPDWFTIQHFRLLAGTTSSDYITQDFTNMLLAKYKYYNVAFETDDTNGDEEFKDKFYQIFVLFKKEFEEKLKLAYGEIEFNLIRHISESNSSYNTDKRDEESDLEGSNSGGLTNSNFDLPHAQSNGYKSSESKSVNNASEHTNRVYTTNNVYEKSSAHEITETGNEVEQRSKYYETYRNIMLEFIDKFKPVFMMIYY